MVGGDFFLHLFSNRTNRWHYYFSKSEFTIVYLMKLLPTLARGLAVAITVRIIQAAVTRWLEHRKKQSLVSPYNPPQESYKPVVDITV